MSRTPRAFLLLPAALLLNGCSALGIFGACEQPQIAAVTVEVRDAVTGLPAAEGATLVIRDGEFADSARGAPGGGSPIIGAGAGRTGVYDVVVRKEGYLDWRRSQVRVDRGGSCDLVQGVGLLVLLQPAGK